MHAFRVVYELDIRINGLQGGNISVHGFVEAGELVFSRTYNKKWC